MGGVRAFIWSKLVRFLSGDASINVLEFWSALAAERDHCWLNSRMIDCASPNASHLEGQENSCTTLDRFLSVQLSRSERDQAQISNNRRRMKQFGSNLIISFINNNYFSSFNGDWQVPLKRPFIQFTRTRLARQWSKSSRKPLGKPGRLLDLGENPSSL